MSSSDTKPLHIPVLLSEILTEFEALAGRKTLKYLDGTLGRGGHLKAVLEKFPQAVAIGVDQDPEAIAYVAMDQAEQIAAGRLELKKMSFHELEAVSEPDLDMMLLDLGVSSPQLDEGRRGFSFYFDGPLDMRMDPTKGKTAADYINEMSNDELFHVFRNYGEIFRPLKVIGRIVERRQERPFHSTLDLAQLIEKAEGWRKKGFHPATPYFMALRILVNNELQGLEDSLPRLLSRLRPGGRLAVLTFHSLEDRIVKNIFRNSEEFGKPVNKKVIVPSREEEVRNPRSRSAKLRVFERHSEERVDSPPEEKRLSKYALKVQERLTTDSDAEENGSKDASDNLSGRETDNQLG